MTENDVKKKKEDEVTSHLLTGKKWHVKHFVQVLKYNR